MNEAKKIQIISVVGGGLAKTTLHRADRLLSGSINFVAKEAWEEAEVCNNEAIRILEELMFKIKENKRIFIEHIVAKYKK